MNWLAHVFLSEQNVDFQMGNVLADPLKGRSWDSASAHIKKGMYIHKLIDAYTDSHLIVKQSKNRLREKGLLKAVIIDLTYDYLLTKNWNKYSNIPLDTFTSDFYTKASSTLEALPPKANMVIDNLIKKDLLNKYHDLEHLELSFLRMDKLLSPRLLKRESASGYINDVHNNIDDIEKDFLKFFPLLCQYTKTHISKNKIAHWKILLFLFLLINKYTKNGAPINAVTTPIGKAESVFKFLEIKSENTKKTPP